MRKILFNINLSSHLLPDCYVEDELDEDNDLMTNNSLKLVYNFEATTLIQGIWWSSAYPESYNEGYLKGIKQIEFSFPSSMGGYSFRTRSIHSKKKVHNQGNDYNEIMLFPQPILTDQLVLSELAFTTKNKDPNEKNTIRFSLELFGCTNYQAEKGNKKNI